MMIPQLPQELWATIYDHFVSTATKRSELTSCMLVNSLAHETISPRLFETFISHPSFRTPAKQFFALSTAAQKSCIKRFYIDHERDLRPHQIELGRVMEQAKDSIERLYYIAPPESGLDFLVASLENLTFLQTSLLQFVVLQQEASKIPLLWAKSLSKLYLDLGRKDPNDEYEVLRLRRLSRAMNRLDLSMFPHLTHVVFLGTYIRTPVKETIPRLLSHFLFIHLFIIVDMVQMNRYRVQQEGDQIHSNLDQNNRVIYYRSNYGRLLLELAFASVCECPLEVLWRKRNLAQGPASDLPFDDWGEITACNQLHVWGWADSVYQAGKKIFGLDIGKEDTLEYRSW
ncbi:hypothetical protein DL96DRAFT_1823938 [Flagelloscypha sp. PMI_526]|nr:hypothetical protein DL96DRAFT_1823938 [Flagelloscypha sp. PMI_526]